MKNMKNKIISIVGMCGAGKTDVSNFLKEHGLHYVRFGDITMDELKRRNLEVNEKNERFVREDLRKIHGMEVYAKLSIPKLEEALKTNHVIADGLYGWTEYLLLKEKFGEQLVVVCVHASPATRIKRLSTRTIRPLTAGEVLSRDKSEIENLQKGGPIAVADYMIVNEDDLKTLKNSVNWVYEKIVKINL